MSLETIDSWVSHGGRQGVYAHPSSATGTNMTFSVFVPPHREGTRLPVLFYLSGLTCTHTNVTEKGEFREACAKAGIVFVAPDTSPRGEGVPDDNKGHWDFGLGAGFYVDATQKPYDRHYRMWTYVTEELPAFVAEHFPVDLAAASIMGHSMGGHGALVAALREPGKWRSVSALAPIVHPMKVPWGKKAFELYLGEDEQDWRAYDAVALIEDGARRGEMLVDVGTEDPFLHDQLCPEALEAACGGAGIALNLRRQSGYDHSYYFISSFMADHVGWHAQRLKGSA
ncbi:S-formylglutathione hydrolase [Sphingomicrobium arenosum]|uniref:S-formylglutathione hydrolase n=1 Tax=Sphingomicrobium arenosum TaxID=2233861 RepID=UPI0022410112|nr:S-formylglutathione hydrolase [Sphingomicrobium arenosum]